MERKRDLFWLKDSRVLILCGGTFAGFLLGMLIFGAPWHLPPAWGDIPTWITAVATVGLLAGAVVTAIYAIRAFRAQSREVSDQAEMLRVQSQQLVEQRAINEKQTEVLELQVAELRESLKEREREAQLRRSAQADQVFISQQNTVDVNPDEDDEPERDRATVAVVNTSNRPIYEAGLRWPPGSSWEFPGLLEPLGTIMPGDRIERVQFFPLGTDMTVNSAILMFRDAARITWTLTPDGELTEKQQSDSRQARQAPSAAVPPD
jgi:membrane protein implicated in regulation of membrane protease activity